MKHAIKKLFKNNAISIVGTQNEFNRRQWVAQTLKRIPAGNRILDAGAGEQQYRLFCDHLRYVSQDFAQYDGMGDGIGLHTKAWDQSSLDIISDITSIPEPDNSFDAILCTEVFEHIPVPHLAFLELNRLLKPSGHLIITAPFSSYTHFAPFHFYTGFNYYFYQRYFSEFGYQIQDLQRNGNYFELFAQEARRIRSVAKKYTQSDASIIERTALIILLNMCRRFSQKDASSSEFACFGYHVYAIKK